MAARSCYWISPSQDPAVYGGFVPSIIYENEDGHFPLVGKGEGSAPWVWGKTLDEAEAIAKSMNEKRGISEEEANEILLLSFRAANLN